jgi:hypothetical protein
LPQQLADNERNQSRRGNAHTCQERRPVNCKQRTSIELHPCVRSSMQNVPPRFSHLFFCAGSIPSRKGPTSRVWDHCPAATPCPLYSYDKEEVSSKRNEQRNRRWRSTLSRFGAMVLYYFEAQASCPLWGHTACSPLEPRSGSSPGRSLSHCL